MAKKIAGDLALVSEAAAAGVVDFGRTGKLNHASCGTELRYGLRVDDRVIVYWCSNCIQVVDFHKDPNSCPHCAVLAHADKSHVWRDPTFGRVYIRCPRFEFSWEKDIKNQREKK